MTAPIITAAIILLCLALFLAGLVRWWMRGKPRLKDTTEVVGDVSVDRVPVIYRRGAP